MPEGDIIFRAARDLHRALAGRTVDSVDARYQEESGFVPTAAGFQMRPVAHAGSTVPQPIHDAVDDDA